MAGICACFVLTSAGVSTAAIRYDNKQRNIVFAGALVGGVPIGGMTFDAARQKIVEQLVDPLSDPVSITVEGQDFITSAVELGVTNNALSQFDKVSSTQEMAMPRRIWTRMIGASIGKRTDVQTEVDEEKLRAFVVKVAAAVDRAPTDTQLSLVEGTLKMTPRAPGFRLDQAKSIDQLQLTIASHQPVVRLSGATLAPNDTKNSTDDVLVVKVGENKLMHYRGIDLVKVYDVATGSNQYPTPKGQFKVANKRLRPTWVNPAKYPGGWGFNLPAKIGPGPGNPLGTRALDLNTPGIRIHGTSAVSSLGYNESHGCIRMRMSDVEELFAVIPVGTPVLIVQAGSNRSMPRRLRTKTPQLTAESDASEVPGQPAPPAPSPTPSASPNEEVPLIPPP